ncbi:MAG: hypothetical protein R3Y68_08950 [Rikenellaceae bacterium]
MASRWQRWLNDVEDKNSKIGYTVYFLNSPTLDMLYGESYELSRITTSNYVDEFVIKFMDLDDNGSQDDNTYSFPRTGVISSHDDSPKFTTKLTYELDPSVTTMPTIEGYGYLVGISRTSGSYTQTYSTSFLTTESYTFNSDTWWCSRNYTAGKSLAIEVQPNDVITGTRNYTV